MAIPAPMPIPDAAQAGSDYVAEGLTSYGAVITSLKTCPFLKDPSFSFYLNTLRIVLIS